MKLPLLQTIFLSALILLSHQTFAEDELVISKDQAITLDSTAADKIINDAVMKLLSQYKTLADLKLQIETQKGVVYLNKSDDKNEIQNAIKLAKSIKGVKEVKYGIPVPKIDPAKELVIKPVMKAPELDEISRVD